MMKNEILHLYHVMGWSVPNMYIQIFYQKLNNIPSILGLTDIRNCKLVMTDESFRDILVDT